jgi:hypothetical protein
MRLVNSSLSKFDFDSPLIRAADGSARLDDSIDFPAR